MNRIFTLLTVLFTLIYFQAQSQDCTDCRYISPLFDSVTVETVHFGEGVDSDGNLQQLYMDIYQPYGDTVTDRPVVIFAFGGGFVQGSKDDWYVQEVCNHFAKAGYVAVANDYRVGINPLEIIQLQHMRIFFRPMQDMRGVVQYLKADYTELGNNYNIDTTKIFVGGASAGAITALMHHYCDQESEMAEMGDISALDDLGGFNSSSGFYSSYNWEGVATVNVAGALINADWIEPGDVPIISAHGDEDQVVPYEYGPLGGGTLGGIFDLQGSYVVDSVANAKGVCSYLFTMEGHDHPNEGMGLEYIRSVVHRLTQRAYAVLNDKSFCCPLQVDVQPNDTLFFAPDDPPAELNATLANDSGNAELKWCSIGCGYSGAGDTMNFQPDTSLLYFSVFATEGQCQSSDLYILMDSTATPESILEHDWQVDFSIYPQPATDQFRLDGDFAGHRGKQLQYQIYNMQGQRILRDAFQPGNYIDVSAVPAGNYLLLLQSADEVLGAEKLLIAR